MSADAWRTAAVSAVFGVGVSWGVAFSVVKEALVEVSPASLVMWRFAIATAVLLAFRPFCLRKIPGTIWLRGAALGGLLASGFLLHTWGMQSTSVVASAFITGTVVVFVPLVARIYPGRALTRRSTGAIALSTVGLAGVTVSGLSVNRGDALIFFAAVLWAVHMVGLEVSSRDGHVYAIAVIQVAVVSLLAAIVEFAAAGAVQVPTRVSTLHALLALGVIATGGAFLALTWAQSRIDATTAAVILTLEPVWGAATAVALGETLSGKVAMGAAAILIAALLVAREERRQEAHGCVRSAGMSPWWTRWMTHRPVARRAL